jgi:hypothetical protein
VKLSAETRAKLGLTSRVALLLGSLGLLGHTVPWDDRVEVGEGATLQVGTLLERTADGVNLVRMDGVRVRLSDAQAHTARERMGLRGLPQRIRPARLALACALYAFGVLMVGVRWNRLLRLLGVNHRLRSSLLLNFQALTVGLVMPGSVGGDVYRVGGLVALGEPLAMVAASVLLDRLVGLWLLLLLSGALGLLGSGLGPGGVNGLLLALGLAVPCVGAVLLLGLDRLPVAVRAQLPLEALAQLTETTRRAPWRWGPVLLASVGNFCAQTGCALCLVAALAPLPLDLGTTVVGVALGFVAWALPLSPGGIGVGEMAFVASLGLAGVAPAAAAGAAVGFRLTAYVVAVAVAPLLLFRTYVPAQAPVLASAPGKTSPDSP